MEKTVRRSFIRTWIGKKYRIGNVSLCEKKGYSCLCMWTTLNWLGKKQHIDPMWKVLMQQVELGEPTTQRECATSKDIVDNHRKMFESRICAGARKSTLFMEI